MRVKAVIVELSQKYDLIKRCWSRAGKLAILKTRSRAQARDVNHAGKLSKQRTEN